jgi:vacuolar-type H+-ATPase subunit E/Vma4
VEAQGEGILREAREKADSQARALRNQALASARMESKRILLKLREEVLRRVLGRARDKLAAAVKQSGYRQVLLGWIVEAAIGLNAPEATASVSAPERALLDEALLHEAEDEIKQLTGRNVSLKAAEGDPLVGQGVVLASTDGRVIFNNQVSTRFLRYQSEIRQIVYEALDR